MIVTVNVTQEHIDRARKQLSRFDSLRCTDCPVALALDDMLQAPYRARVYQGSFSILSRDLEWTYQVDNEPLPDSVQTKIAAFDGQNKMQPFSFELSLPDHVVKEGVTA